MVLPSNRRLGLFSAGEPITDHTDLLWTVTVSIIQMRHRPSGFQIQSLALLLLILTGKSSKSPAKALMPSAGDELMATILLRTVVACIAASSPILHRRITNPV